MKGGVKKVVMSACYSPGRVRRGGCIVGVCVGGGVLIRGRERTSFVWDCALHQPGARMVREQSNKRLNQPHPMQQPLHNTRRVNGEVRFIDPVPGDLGSLHLTGE